VPVAPRLRNLIDVMAITKCLSWVPPVRGFTVARGLRQCVPRPATGCPFAGLMEPIIMSNASDELRKLRNAELDAAPIRHLNEEELCAAGLGGQVINMGRHRDIFCRSDRPRPIDTWRKSAQTDRLQFGCLGMR
jgi:hypothetical protein